MCAPACTYALGASMCRGAICQSTASTYHVVSLFLSMCARLADLTFFHRFARHHVLSCLGSPRVTDVCYWAHPYGGFWKAQLRSSHKKQAWSLVQYFSLTARKGAKNCLSLKDFPVSFGK